MQKSVEELLRMSEDELCLELGKLVDEKGVDGLFDTSQLKDEKDWERYRRLRADIEQIYKKWLQGEKE
jgi:hypothetical protein